MLRRKDGLIINVVSIAGKRASPLGGVVLRRVEIRHERAGHRSRRGGKGQRHPRVQHLSRRGGHAHPRSAAATRNRRAPRRILRPEDVASAVVFVASLPPHVSIPELVIKPTWQMYV